MDIETSTVPETYDEDVPNIEDYDAESLIWARDVASEAMTSQCLTMGIVNGSRYPADFKTIQTLTRAASEELEAQGGRSLLLRLAADHSLESVVLDESRIPVAQRSPLGPWSELIISTTNSPPNATADCLAKWLPEWKPSFQLLLLDLGPIDSPLSRMAGRLCDASFLLLGPRWCGSQDWITQQIAWHHRSGSTVCGTILAE